MPFEVCEPNEYWEPSAAISAVWLTISAFLSAGLLCGRANATAKRAAKRMTNFILKCFDLTFD